MLILPYVLPLCNISSSCQMLLAERILMLLYMLLFLGGTGCMDYNTALYGRFTRAEIPHIHVRLQGEASRYDQDIRHTWPQVQSKGHRGGTENGRRIGRSKNSGYGNVKTRFQQI